MRRPLVVLCALTALAGCSREEDTTDVPGACKDPGAVVAALGGAPSSVSLDGAPLSDCFASERPSGGDVQLVGATMLEAALRLGKERDAAALGYLVGSMRRNPDVDHGFFAESLRRVEQEVAPFTGSAAFRRGLRAGRTSG